MKKEIRRINFVNILQGNLQIQFNPYQDTNNGIFHRTTANDSKTGMETWKSLNSQNNLKKEQSWKYHVPWFQIILQSYSNQNSMILPQKQTQINGTE